MTWDDPARAETAYYAATKSAGPYRLLRPLAQSETEQKWEGVRLHPHRPACVRLLAPPDPDSPARAALHFEVRRLARLRAPGLAAVYESGDTEDGLIWIATELVEDAPLEAWRTEGRASQDRAARLAVALELCARVQRAHLCGALLPALHPGAFTVSDSLPRRVTLHDAGLACWLPAPGGRAWAYRSPEQDLAAAEPDARSDVYSLAVILFELLTGEHPFLEPGEGGAASLQARRTGGPRPVAGLNAGLARTFAQALALNPDERFASADALAQALRNETKAPATPARWGRAALYGALALLLALSGWQFWGQRKLRHDLDQTTALLKREQEVIGFLADSFGTPSVVNTPERAAHSKALLADALQRARRDHIAQPPKLAAHLTAIATAYGNLGEFQTAVSVDQEALEILTSGTPRVTTELADVYAQLAIFRYNLSQYPEAAESARRSVEIWRRIEPLDPDGLASALSSLGQAQGAMGRYQDAGAPLQEAVGIYRRHGVSGSDYLDALRAYGVNLTRQGLWEEGLPLLRESAEKYLTEQGSTSHNYLRTLNDLANALALSGKLGEAAARQTDLIGVVRKVMGPDSANLGISHLNLATTLTKLNTLDKAREELAAGKAIFVKALGAQHPRFGEFLRAEGDIESRAGQHARALAILRQALQHERNTLPAGSLNAGLTTASLAMAQRRAGETAAAAETTREALTLLQSKLPATHPLLAELRAGAAGQ
jgi:serine/threonine-protein kinase